MEKKKSQISIDEINNFVFNLEKKIDKCELQRERLLADFINKFDMDNMSIVDQYDKADKLIERSLAFLNKRKKQLLLKRQLMKDSENHEKYN